MNNETSGKTDDVTNKILNNKILNEILPNGTMEDYIGLFMDGVSVFNHFITCRMELIIFDLVNETLKASDDELMSWEEYVDFLAQWKRMIDTAKEIIKLALENFPQESFDFSVPDKKAKSHDDYDGPDDHVTIVMLYKDTEAAVLLLNFQKKIEHAYFDFLCNSKKDYQWEQYLQDIQSDNTMLDRIDAAFHRAIVDLDFKKYFDSPEIIEKFLK